MDYYVYAYLNEDGTPFYIGKGCGKRINWKWGRSFEIPPPERRVFLYKNLTEEDALNKEREVIAEFGKENLLNKTTGGQGVSGLTFSQSEEWKRMMSERFSGENNPFYGKTHDEEAKSKMRQGQIRARTPEWREKMSKARAGDREWCFISPEGEKVCFRGSLNAFCKERGLNTTAMSYLHRGMNYKQHKGWRRG